MGDDGLESTTDYSGPHTLNKARKIMERLLKGNDPWVNPYLLHIRGPRHSNSKGLPTEFYNQREDK